MQEDWQAEFLTSRHVHNRQSRNRAFQSPNGADITRAFGSYDLKCSAAESLTAALYQENIQGTRTRTRKNKDHKKQSMRPRFDIHSLTENEDGLVGDIFLPGILDVSIIMAGSRKQLKEILDAGECSTREDRQEERVSEIPPGTPVNHADGEDPESDCTLQDESNEGLEHDTLMPAETLNREAKEQMRSRNFEKNTFRQPKFWLSWHGSILAQPDSSTNSSVLTTADKAQSGMGYIVFAGNKYQKFKGTINCDLLGWKDVALSGWKR